MLLAYLAYTSKKENIDKRQIYNTLFLNKLFIFFYIEAKRLHFISLYIYGQQNIWFIFKLFIIMHVWAHDKSRHTI